MEAEQPRILAITATDEQVDDVLEVVISTNCDSGPGKTFGLTHPWFRRFKGGLHFSNETKSGHGKVTVYVRRNNLEDAVRAILQAAQEADSAYREFLHEQRERSEQEDAMRPTKQARLAADQARIDAVLDQWRLGSG